MGKVLVGTLRAIATAKCSDEPHDFSSTLESCLLHCQSDEWRDEGVSSDDNLTTGPKDWQQEPPPITEKLADGRSLPRFKNGEPWEWSPVSTVE